LAGLHRAARWVAYHHGYTGTSRAVRLYEELDRWSLRGAARVITVCSAFAADLARRGVRPERLHVQHTPIRSLGVPEGEASAGLRAELAIPESMRVVLAVGRLSREKGHADLVRAFAELRRSQNAPPLKLVVAGDGPERAALERLAGELDIAGDVILAGHRHSIREFYALADAFVLPSHSEGSPNVLLEAMDAGVPVVATRVGGVPELAVHERDALLTERGDISGMAAAIGRVLRGGDLRERLLAGGRAVVERQSPARYYEEIRRVLDGLKPTALPRR
jgi:glycosyltransferase involved in cell wall biosynthesis